MKSEIGRSILNRYMLLVIIVVSMILGNTFFQYSLSWKKQDILSLIANPMAISGFTPFAGMFPALPNGLQFVKEYNSGYIRFLLVREGKEKYIKKRILCTFISGGISIACSFGVIFLLAIIYGLPVTDKMKIYLSFYQGSIWWPIITVGGGRLVLLLKIFLAFLFGAVWSMVCLMFSIITINQYVSFVLTFVIYQILWFVFIGKKYNPVYLLRGDSTVYACLGEPFLIQIIVLVVVIIVSGIFMKRRLNSA